MQLDKISLADSRAFSPFFIDYITRKENLKPFYHRFPVIENFASQVEEKKKSFTASQRTTLVDVLRSQYADLKVSPSFEQNLTSLSDENTFTVTTGHQLNIFTGPLYFIYKIITVVNTCKKLKQQYPDFNFVPVYWMASEDHDYEEIKYFRLYGQKYVWETTQSGAVGRFSTKGLAQLADQLPGDTSVFKTAYSKHKTLAAAVRHYVNELFGSKGVVVLDADDKQLKAEFAKVIHDDVRHNTTKPIVDQTNASLEELGYKTQVYCRDINFFYLTDDSRNRIERQGEVYQVVDTDITFTDSEIKNEIDSHPERFSPNVILRPLYQEFILPNLAYVGGPAEVIYWLQLKDVFNHFNMPFPMLMPRNFAMVVDHEVSRKFSKTGLDVKDLFEDKNYIFNHWVLANTSHALSVTEEHKEIDRIYNELQARAESIDVTLKAFVGAAHKRTSSHLDKIAHKMLRAEKRLHADRLNQIDSVKDTLFPKGSLQERTDNFLNFYQRDAKFIDHLEKAFDPFDFQFNILTYTP